MHHLTVQTTAVTHQIYARARRIAQADGPIGNESPRDRGAVSLEQVLWFVAAGISVAGIAFILWGQINDAANTPVEMPQSP